jgi:hypothetical protein
MFKRRNMNVLRSLLPGFHFILMNAVTGQQLTWIQAMHVTAKVIIYGLPFQRKYFCPFWHGDEGNMM